MPISIRITESFDALEKPAHAWERLATDERLHIFSGPAWNLAWWKAFGNGKRLRLYAGYDGSELVGVWPFCIRKGSFKDLRGTVIETLSGRSSDYGLPAVRTGHEDAFVGAVAEDLFSEARGKILDFPHLPVGHPAALALDETIKGTGARIHETASICPRLEFGEDYASTEKSWKKSLRTDLRRQRRRLEDAGRLNLHVPEGKEEVLAFLPLFFRMHSARWSRRGFNMKFLDGEEADFYRALVEGLHGRGLHFSYLSCGNEIISMHFGFVSNKWLFWYTPAYNPDFERHSPGKVHIGMLVERGLMEGLKGIDFLQGDEPYKLQWSTGKVETLSLTCAAGLSLRLRWLVSTRPWLIENFGRFLRRRGPVPRPTA
ncbi:MAG: GNAT family N-acetyltransferase [Candidatus Methylomirabilis sp.]|nr:GNAT family N-acetyltransferase [Deltaproteobacteria bacterium]